MTQQIQVASYVRHLLPGSGWDPVLSLVFADPPEGTSVAVEGFTPIVHRLDSTRIEVLAFRLLEKTA